MRMEKGASFGTYIDDMLLCPKRIRIAVWVACPPQSGERTEIQNLLG